MKFLCFEVFEGKNWEKGRKSFRIAWRKGCLKAKDSHCVWDLIPNSPTKAIVN